MARKYTQIEAESKVAEYGWTLIDTYININTPVKMRCPDGHVVYKTLDNLKRSGCSECYGNTKYTQDDIEKIYRERGCTFNDVYENNHTVYNYTCKCGYKAKKTVCAFINQKQYCIKCGGRGVKTIDEIKKEAKKDGTICISDSYVNSKEKLTFICPKEHVYTMIWNSFQQGNRCRDCQYENIRGENHQNWNDDRTIAKRIEYLKFDTMKIDILYDDPNYDNYLISKELARTEREYNVNKHARNSMSVDHIFPRKAFIYNDLDIKYGNKIIKEICNRRDNLKIITRKENGHKGAKYNQEEFMSWFNEIIKKY